MKKVPHYHKYEKMTWPNGRIFYKCMEPNCPHYLPVATLIIGRESQCWGPNCNKLVLITKEDFQKGIKHPMCENCKALRLEKREELGKI